MDVKNNSSQEISGCLDFDHQRATEVLAAPDAAFYFTAFVFVLLAFGSLCSFFFPG